MKIIKLTFDQIEQAYKLYAEKLPEYNINIEDEMIRLKFQFGTYQKKYYISQEKKLIPSSVIFEDLDFIQKHLWNKKVGKDIFDRIKELEKSLKRDLKTYPNWEAELQEKEKIFNAAGPQIKYTSIELKDKYYKLLDIYNDRKTLKTFKNIVDSGDFICVEIDDVVDPYYCFI